MISLKVERPVERTDSTIKRYIEGACTSSDSKPTDVANGSILMEMDTSQLYMFDEDAGAWRVWS